MTFEPIDVSDLTGHPGASREVSVTGTLETLTTEVASVPGEVTARLLLESVVEGILVSGQVRGVLSMRCARCLDRVERPLEVQVQELYRDRPDPDGDEYPLEPDGALDPGPMILDALGLELPFAPLCRPDCLGICETCGENRNLGRCPGHEQVDPRWAGLEEVFSRLEG